MIASRPAPYLPAARAAYVLDEVVKVGARSRDSIWGNPPVRHRIERDVFVVSVVVLGRANPAIGNQQKERTVRTAAA
jgi:hypothetical protein